MSIDTFLRQHLQESRDPYRALKDRPLPQPPVRAHWQIWPQ